MNFVAMYYDYNLSDLIPAEEVGGQYLYVRVVDLDQVG